MSKMLRIIQDGYKIYEVHDIFGIHYEMEIEGKKYFYDNEYTAINTAKSLSNYYM